MLFQKFRNQSYFNGVHIIFHNTTGVCVKYFLLNLGYPWDLISLSHLHFKADISCKDLPTNRLRSHHGIYTTCKKWPVILLIAVMKNDNIPNHFHWRVLAQRKCSVVPQNLWNQNVKQNKTK